jgi:hypothetical protein
MGIPVYTNVLWDKGNDRSVEISINLFDFLMCVIDELNFTIRGMEDVR